MHFVAVSRCQKADPSLRDLAGVELGDRCCSGWFTRSWCTNGVPQPGRSGTKTNNAGTTGTNLLNKRERITPLEPMCYIL